MQSTQRQKNIAMLQMLLCAALWSIAGIFIMNGTAADGTLALLELRLGIESLTLGAILALVGALVDVALII